MHPADHGRGHLDADADAPHESLMSLCPSSCPAHQPRSVLRKPPLLSVPPSDDAVVLRSSPLTVDATAFTIGHGSCSDGEFDVGGPRISASLMPFCKTGKEEKLELTPYPSTTADARLHGKSNETGYIDGADDRPPPPLFLPSIVPWQRPTRCIRNAPALARTPKSIVLRLLQKAQAEQPCSSVNAHTASLASMQHALKGQEGLDWQHGQQIQQAAASVSCTR